VRKLFLLAALTLIVLLVVVAVGPSLPEGNAIRGVGEGIRDMLSGMGGGFGGGYQPVTPAG
jgi:hypothetical protein